MSSAPSERSVQWIRTLRSSAGLMNLHRKSKQISERIARLARLRQARLDVLAERLDLVGEVALDRALVLSRGAALGADEELHDVVHAGADGGGAEADLIEVGEGAVQGDAPRVDELDGRRAEAVGVTDVFEAVHRGDQLEVRRCRDEGQLAYKSIQEILLSSAS